MANSKRPVAVITGASSGIGYATAIEFAANGYNLVLAARRRQELKKVADECKREGVKAEIVTADTANENHIEKIRAAAIDNFGHINIWVNNAAVYLMSRMEDTPPEDIRRVVDTNFMGCIYGSRIAIATFKKQRYGTLVNISSIGVSAPQAFASVYSATKYAVRGLSEALRSELQADSTAADIHVCTVLPASIDTNLYNNAANYTGKKIQTTGPVTDPKVVAQAIFNLVDNPKPESFVGSSGKNQVFQRAAALSLFDKLTARSSRPKNQLNNDELAGMTRGSLYESSPNKGMRGGLNNERQEETADKQAAVIAAVVAAGATLLGGVLLAYEMRKSKRGFLDNLVYKS